MSTNDWITIAVIIVLAIVAAFLAAMESAVRTLTPSKADEMELDGVSVAGKIKDYTADPAPYTTALLLLRITCEMSAVILAMALLFTHVPATGGTIALAIVVTVLASFIVWGVAPRTLGVQHYERVARATIRPLGVISTILWPLSQILIAIGNALTPGKGFSDGPFNQDVEMMARASEGERQMINSVFELGETLVRAVMVPRTDIIYIEESKTIRQGLSLALRSGFSRIPVVGDGGIDDVVGLVYVKDLMRRMFDKPGAEHSETIGSVMRDAPFVPDSKTVDDLMAEMQRSRHHLVIVIDEFGGTAGLATIEDILEEIVGDITDEYDTEPDEAHQVNDTTWTVSARMPIDEVGDLFGLELADEDVETVGGLLAKELNMAPIPGSSVVWRGLEITAHTQTSRRHQIDTCLVRLLDVDELSDGESDHE